MRNVSYQRSLEVYLGFIALVICVFPKLITLAIIGLLFFTVFGFAKRKITLSITPLAALLALFYGMYLVGAIFSNNHYLSGLYIENKLTFIIFPLLLSFRFKQPMDFRPIVLATNLGVLILFALGIVNALKCSETFTQAGTFSCFTSSNLSTIHHPSYYSIYILVAIFSTWFGYFKKWKSFNLAWIVPFMLIALVIYGLCLSLSGYLFLFLLLFVVFMVFVYRRFGKRKFWVVLIITPLLVIAAFASIPQIKRQFVDSKTVFLQYAANPEKFVHGKTGYKQGDDIRVIMWTASSQEFASHLLGVGTGNVDFHLSQRLHSYGQHEMAKMDEHGTILYNPHNQFLQTGLEIGLAGLAVFLLILITAIQFAFRHQNWILLLLASSLFFNSLFESILQRQSGIVFFSFWICIALVYSKSQQKSAESDA